MATGLTRAAAGLLASRGGVRALQSASVARIVGVRGLASWQAAPAMRLTHDADVHGRHGTASALVAKEQDVARIYAALQAMQLLEVIAPLNAVETEALEGGFQMSSVLKKRRKKMTKHKQRKRRKKDRYKNKP
mmetsp:Transcript_1750/g.3165  ORF Transcript_1750/g.3165 Transcript_1750/m.3165 type:complete len:133 (+) Transcript_1750:37-435(+)